MIASSTGRPDKVISISAIPEDDLDRIIHAKLFNRFDEAPPYASHDGTAMQVVEKMRELGWCWDIQMMPGAVDVLLHSEMSREDGIQTTATSFASAVCLAAKQVFDVPSWGLKFETMLPVSPVGEDQ